jgi:hypothetical protein
VGWFSTPPPGDAHLGVEQSSLGSQATTATAGGPIAASLNHTSHPEVTDDAEPSMVTEALETPRKSPPTTGKCQRAVAYAYRTAPVHKRTTPVDLAILDSPSGAGSMAAVPPIPRQASSEMDQKPTLPSQGSSEPRNGGGAAECPPPGKQKSHRKRKREESRKLAASATAVLPAITDASSTPTEITPTTPTTAEIGEARPGDDDQTKLDASLSSMPTDKSPEQLISAQLGAQQAGQVEDVDSTRKAVETEPRDDDPALRMRAGLIVNGVSGHRGIHHHLSTIFSQWPYTALSDLRVGAMMSMIGVVCSVNKEPARSKTGGTSYTAMASYYS